MQKAETLETENDLIKQLSEPKPKINLSKKKIKEVKNDFSELRYGFSKSKINKLKKMSFRTGNKKGRKKYS